eukprot:4222972-Pleurochrysis_carterae.AAC.1
MHFGDSQSYIRALAYFGGAWELSELVRFCWLSRCLNRRHRSVERHFWAFLGLWFSGAVLGGTGTREFYLRAR